MTDVQAEDLRKLHDDCVVAEGVKVKRYLTWSILECSWQSLAIKGYLQFIDFFSETRRLCNIHRYERDAMACSPRSAHAVTCRTSILHFQQERKLAEKRTAEVFFEVLGVLFLRPPHSLRDGEVLRGLLHGLSRLFPLRPLILRRLAAPDR